MNQKSAIHLPPTNLIAIHGVGDAKPGIIPNEIAKAISSVSSNASNNAYIQSDISLEGVRYPCLKSENSSANKFGINKIIEVNWSDIQAPSNSILSVIRHLFLLLMGMRRLSTEKLNPGSPFPPIFAHLFWISVEVFIWWTAYIATVVMWLASLTPSNQSMVLPVTIAATIIAALMAWGLGKYSSNFKAGYVWSILVFLVGVNFTIEDPWFSQEEAVTCSAWLYSWTQAFMGLCLILAFLETFFIANRYSWNRAAARAAFMWLPFLIICGIGAASWVLSVYSASIHFELEGNADWQKQFLTNLQYDLLKAELGTLFAVLFILIIIPSIGSFFYFSTFLRKWAILITGRKSLNPGEVAHSLYSIILKTGPWLLILGGLPFWYSLLSGSSSESNLTLLEIYKISATRWISAIPLFIPALRIMLDVAGDVVFHLQPEQSQIGTKGRTTDRITKLVEHLNQNDPKCRIVILAHSQGSIIAREAIERNSHLSFDKLITIGSPIKSLYFKFLGEDLDKKLTAKSSKWINLYNDGDYIGGHIENCDKSKILGKGGHTGYWSNPNILKYL